MNGVSEQCSVYYARPPTHLTNRGARESPHLEMTWTEGFHPDGRSDQATKRNEAILHLMMHGIQ